VDIPLVFADNAFYRQLNHAEQLEVLQKQMALPCDQWPAEVDIEVCGEDAFNVDRRGWQADAFSHFVLPAGTDSVACEVAFSDVLRYLSERYWVEPDCEKAARMAVFITCRVWSCGVLCCPLSRTSRSRLYWWRPP